MTQNPDDPVEPPEGEPAGLDEGRAGPLDEDAAWKSIVENYGEPALAEEPQQPEQPEADRAGSPDDQRDEGERLRGLFQPRWDDPLQTEATWDDEGHFVPPSPPPFPPLEPRRRAAWAGLFGAPLLMLVAVVLGWRLPGWVMAGLALAFAGGFVYLVATMPRRPGDGSGDDGAVV